MKLTKTLTAAMIFAAFSLSAGLVVANNHHKMGGGTPCAGMANDGVPCPMNGTPGTAMKAGGGPCAAMDTDGNGSVDEQEFNTMREQRMAAMPTFAELDTDGDGVVTGEEMAAMHQERMGKRGKGRGHHGMMGNKGMGCQGQGQQAMDPETQEKHDAFMAATVELRKELAVKRAEKRAVMLSVNPDPDQAAQLTRDLLELRGQMMAQAEEAGVDFVPGKGCANGRGGQGAMGRGGCGGGCR
jgi:zinc resistance-associated protein